MMTTRTLCCRQIKHCQCITMQVHSAVLGILSLLWKMGQLLTEATPLVASKGRPDELAGEIWLPPSTETRLRSGGGAAALAVGDGWLLVLGAESSASELFSGSSFPGAVSTLQILLRQVKLGFLCSYKNSSILSKRKIQSTSQLPFRDCHLLSGKHSSLDRLAKQRNDCADMQEHFEKYDISAAYRIIGPNRSERPCKTQACK